ncbi:histidine phosphatase family protein [bacterium]|nr:histidine phosphatase family protein [bacterium]
MQLYLIRHAQSENNVIMDANIKDYQDAQGLKIYESHRFADAPLSRRGFKQADMLGKFLAGATRSPDKDTYRDRFNFNDFNFTHLLVSPMIRTLDTAKSIVDRVNLKPVVWDKLHEQGGVWNIDRTNGQRVGFPGATPDYIRMNYPDFTVPVTMNPNGWWNQPYEEPETCYKRSGDVLDLLIREHGKTDHRIAVVTHSYFINCIFYQLFNLSAVNREFLFVLNNVSVSRIDFVKQRRILVYQNRTDFLPPNLIT